MGLRKFLGKLKTQVAALSQGWVILRVLPLSLSLFHHFITKLRNQHHSDSKQYWLWAITTVLKNYLQKTDLPEEQGAWRENRQENQNSNETTNNYKEVIILYSRHCELYVYYPISPFNIWKWKNMWSYQYIQGKKVLDLESGKLGSSL